MTSQFRQCVECGAPLGASKVCGYCGFGSKGNRVTYYLEIGDQEEDHSFAYMTGQQEREQTSRDVFTFSDFGTSQSLEDCCEQNSGYSFIFCFQRVLQYQVDCLVDKLKFPPILRKAVADIWLDYVDEIKYKKPLLRSKINKKNLHKDMREKLHRFVKVNSRALRKLYLRKEVTFVGFLLPKLKPYDTLAFIYLACATIGHPVMLSVLRHWTMNSTLPYRRVCTELFSNDPRFRKFSTNTFSFNMYTEDNMASNFREGDIPDCRTLWNRVKKIAIRKIKDSSLKETFVSIPDLNCQILLHRFYTFFLPDIPQEECETLTTYTCRLIRSYRANNESFSTHFEYESEMSSIPFWKNPLSEKFMSPCMFLTCFICLTLKLCFGLDRSLESSNIAIHPKWAQYFVNINRNFSRQNRGGILINDKPLRIQCSEDTMSLSNFLQMTIQEKTFHHTLLRSSLHKQLFKANNLQAGIKANTLFLAEMNIQGLQPLLKEIEDLYGEESNQGSYNLPLPSVNYMKKKSQDYKLLFDIGETVENNKYFDLNYLLQSICWFMGIDPHSKGYDEQVPIAKEDSIESFSFKTLLNHFITIIETILLGVGGNNLSNNKTHVYGLSVYSLRKLATIRKPILDDDSLYQLERRTGTFNNEYNKELWDIFLPIHQVLFPDINYRKTFSGHSQIVKDKDLQLLIDEEEEKDDNIHQRTMINSHFLQICENIIHTPEHPQSFLSTLQTTKIFSESYHVFNDKSLESAIQLAYNILSK